nr:hypothetical protein [Tanacetum cinerariifolium]
MSTQEYIRKVVEDVGEDDDFMRASWLSAIDYVNVDGRIVTAIGANLLEVTSSSSTMGNLPLSLIADMF